MARITLDLPARVAAWLEAQPGGPSAWVRSVVEPLVRLEAGEPSAPGSTRTDTRRAVHPIDCMCDACRIGGVAVRRLTITLTTAMLDAVQQRMVAESLSQGDVLRSAIRAGLPEVRARQDGQRGLTRGRAAAGGTTRVKLRLTRELETALIIRAKGAGVNLAEAVRQALDVGLQ